MAKRIIALLLFFTLLGSITHVQAQLKVGVHAGAGFPTGSFGQLVGIGFGAGVSAEYLVLDQQFGFGLIANYSSFGFRSLSSVNVGHWVMAPISIFGRYYLSTESVRPFVGLEAGEYYVKSSEFAGTTPTGRFNPGLAPVGGFVFQLSEAFDFNLSAKYHIVFSSNYQNASQFTYLALNAGVSLKLGR